MIITKERKHDGVDKPLTTVDSLKEVDELREYISEMWNKEIKKVSPDDRVIIQFTVHDKTKKKETDSPILIQQNPVT